METANSRLQRAYLSLKGLSVGDAFGDRFFVHPYVLGQLIDSRTLPTPPWRFSDDTMMALSIVSILRQYGSIDQDQLARSFADRYDKTRGYGLAMHNLLNRFRAGESWQQAASSLFEGQGSYGNGAAMRVAPLGAYFAEDLQMVVDQAALSSVVTHSHPEAIAGAIAVAVAAAWAVRLHEEGRTVSRSEFLDLILPSVPKSEVSSNIEKARDMDNTTSVMSAVSVLGSGTRLSAQDTVPFALWCAGSCLDNFIEALWLTLSGYGDCDTNCAIVGGIVALSAGEDSIPAEWIAMREPLPDWPFEE